MERDLSRMTIELEKTTTDAFVGLEHYEVMLWYLKTLWCLDHWSIETIQWSAPFLEQFFKNNSRAVAEKNIALPCELGAIYLE